MSWLLHSKQLKINKGHLSLPTAKELWDAETQTYPKAGRMT